MGVVAILLVMSIIPGVKMSFMDSFCRFNVVIRWVFLGNPLMGTFTSIARSLSIPMPNLPLVCERSPKWESTNENPLSIEQFFFKLSNECVRCWSIFGEGTMDSLIFTPEGQQFSCFEDVVYIDCSTVEKDENGNPLYSFVDETLFKEYLETHKISSFAGGWHASYSEYLGAGNPLWTNIASPICNSTQIENGDVVKYLVIVYYLDVIGKLSLGNPNIAGFYTSCGTFTIPEVGADSILICLNELE